MIRMISYHYYSYNEYGLYWILSTIGQFLVKTLLTDRWLNFMITLATVENS